jgi:hypothetical protein
VPNLSCGFLLDSFSNGSDDEFHKVILGKKARSFEILAPDFESPEEAESK